MGSVFRGSTIVLLARSEKWQSAGMRRSKQDAIESFTTQPSPKIWRKSFPFDVPNEASH